MPVGASEPKILTMSQHTVPNVTAIEVRLYPVKDLYAGWLIFPMERAEEVLNAWRDWVDTVPNEVTSVGRLLQIPPLPDVPEPLRGRRLVVVEAAMIMDEARASRLLKPLRKLGPEMDTFATIPASRLQELHMDPPEPVPGLAQGVEPLDIQVFGDSSRSRLRCRLRCMHQNMHHQSGGSIHEKPCRGRIQSNPVE